jgi:deoxyadenosine kinase
MSSYTATYGGKKHFIGVSGIIGAGKSTLTSQLSKELGFEMIEEPVKENPYLPLFYEDMLKYGFTMQIFLLGKRFEQHQGMIWGRHSAIQDRTIWEDVIFAKMLHEAGNMTDLDFNTYQTLFESMTNFLRRLDIIVYLDVSPETALKRIHLRGRECEKSIPLEYLKALKKGYEDWLTHMEKEMTVIRIPWDEFKTTEYVIEQIQAAMRRPLPIIPKREVSSYSTASTRNSPIEC